MMHKKLSFYQVIFRVYADFFYKTLNRFMKGKVVDLQFYLDKISMQENNQVKMNYCKNA